MMIIITLIIIKTIKKTIQNYQKDTIKIMLKYLPPIAQCTKKSDFAAWFSKCFRILRSITQ